MDQPNLLSLIEQCIAAQLVIADSADEYSFRHALLHDAVYGMLLRRERKSLHLRVGETLERLQPDRLASRELAPLLAHHFDVGGDERRALKYLTIAGDHAIQVYANAEALSMYSRALDMIQDGATATNEQVTHLYAARGRAFELTGRFSQALANYADMEAAARQRGDRAMQLASLITRATIYATTSAVRDQAMSQTLSDQALALAREIGDRRAQAKIFWNLSLLNTWNGHPREAVEYGEQSLAIARELNLREQLAYTLNDLSLGYLALGRTDETLRVLAEARTLWHELNNKPMLGDNLARASVVHWLTGNYAQCQTVSEEMMALSKSYDHAWGQAEAYFRFVVVFLEWGEMNRAREAGAAAIRLGEQAGHLGAALGASIVLAGMDELLGAVQQGLERARASVSKAEATFAGWRPWAQAVLARLLLLRNDLAEADKQAKAAAVAVPPEDFLTFVPVMLADGEVALALKENDRALARAEQAILFLRRARFRYLLSDALYLRGRALWQSGRIDQAYEVLRQARTEAEAVGSRRSLLSILAALSELETQRGHVDEAMALRHNVEGIAHHVKHHSYC